MKLNPFKRFRGGSLAQQPEVEDVTGSTVSITKYDESVLQQSRFWMRTVTWTLIGTTVFGVAWLALARTEEIVVATGKLEPIGSVKKIQMPVGGFASEIIEIIKISSVKNYINDYFDQWISKNDQ